MPLPDPGSVVVPVQPLSDLLVDRKYISRYSIEPFTFELKIGGVPADADFGQVIVSFDGAQDPPGNIFQRLAARLDVGVYQVTLSSVDTSLPGLYQMAWLYEINSTPQIFVGHVEVGESSPAYDALDTGFKAIIESAYIRFADLFDSPYGGPHLQVYFQSHFNRNRMAQLLQIALNRLNTISQPHMSYSLDPAAKPFPYEQWGGLLDQALYIECLKHLIRSYTEQPEAQGVNVARLDRRDYMQRWQTVLDQEVRDFAGPMDVFKMAHMGLGRPHVLVSGGVFGNYGPTRLPGTPAQPRAWSRGY